MARLSYLFAAVCVICLSGLAAAETYVVYPDGSGDYTTIQHALWNVETGDVIELIDGTYTGDGNRDINFSGKQVTVRSQSGNPEACIIDSEGTEGEPHRAFIFDNEEGPGSILEGITITGGWVGTSCGGAVKIRVNSSPTITNCRFIENHGDCVGAIFVQDGSPMIVDCLFEANTALVGLSGEVAGLFLGTDCTSVITRCTFRNHTTGAGTAAFMRFNADVRFVDCLFSGNQSEQGAGIYCEDDAIVSVENCTFVDNEATHGAHIFCTDQSVLTVTNSLLANSTGGDAIECEGTSLVSISCCDVWGNTGGDWVGCLAGMNGVDGNISDDPCFCLDSFYIAETSLCAAANNSCGVTIGALGTECVDCGGDVPTLEVSWGQLKAGYR